MNSYYSIFIGNDDQYYFNLKAGNHEIILQSEGYKTKNSCENGISSVQKNSSTKSRYERRTSEDNKPYFVLKASNGEIIGVSETYNSEQAMENGILSVIQNGKTSIINDDTSKRETIIIVNGREKEWNKKEISFKELVILAFGSYVENNRTCYTITYTRGNNQKPQGSLVEGESVIVKHKMIFNVTATDKS